MKISEYPILWIILIFTYWKDIHKLVLLSLPPGGILVAGWAIFMSKITLNQEDMKLLENIAEMKSGNRESDQYMEMALEGVARKSKL